MRVEIWLIWIFTEEVLPIVNKELVELVKDNVLKIKLTSVKESAITRLPVVLVPVNVYVPEVVIVTMLSLNE